MLNTGPFDARTGALKRTYAHNFGPLPPSGPRKAERAAEPSSAANMVPPIRTGGWVPLVPGTDGHGRVIAGEADSQRRA